MPSPPNWMSIKITLLPKNVKLLLMSTTLKPVTVTAEVAVKSASKKVTWQRSTVAKGRVSNAAPTHISAMNERMIRL